MIADHIKLQNSKYDWLEKQKNALVDKLSKKMR